jgi:hypothetical protein
VVDDLARLFGGAEPDVPFDVDAAAPGGLWDPAGESPGGVNWGDEVEPRENQGGRNHT